MRTSHSSYYVEREMLSSGKTPEAMGLPPPEFRIAGGAFPIWLSNAPCCPIAVVSVYSGSSQDDHLLVVKSIRDYLLKMAQVGSEGRPDTPLTLHPGGSAVNF